MNQYNNYGKNGSSGNSNYGSGGSKSPYNNGADPGSSYNGTEMLDYLERHVSDLRKVDGEAACKAVGSPRALNMIMLGQAIRCGVLPFTIDDIEQTMKATVKPQFVEMNSKALRLE